MGQGKLPPVLVNWCRDVLGWFRVVSTHSQQHSESEIWRLRAGKLRAYLKLHYRSAKWGMEVHAYEQWVSALGIQAPQLLAVMEEPLQAILITELRGVLVDQAVLTTDQERCVWNAAGTALARLQSASEGEWFGVPRRCGQARLESPEQNPVALVRSTLQEWLTQGMDSGVLRPQEIAMVHQAIAMAEVFAGDRPVPSHGDYQPHNWLVSIDGDWRGVIDFEHARWDLKFSDIGYWWDRNFFQRPDLKDAFLAGYGHDLTEREHTQLDVIRILSGVGRILWGCQYGDAATEALGRQVLEELTRSHTVV